jgi:hypothetical protein
MRTSYVRHDHREWNPITNAANRNAMITPMLTSQKLAGFKEKPRARRGFQ